MKLLSDELQTHYLMVLYYMKLLKELDSYTGLTMFKMRADDPHKYVTSWLLFSWTAGFMPTYAEKIQRLSRPNFLKVFGSERHLLALNVCLFKLLSCLVTTLQIKH